MKTSGKVAIKMDCENPVDDTCTVTDGDLSDDMHGLLLELYKTKVPRLEELHNKYEQELKRAKNRRQKSTFPAFNKWIPTGGLLTGDQELLQGPSKHVTVQKKIVIEEENTNRFVTYAAADHDSTSSRYCSYARVLSDTNPPRLGQIRMCFSHTFIGHTCTFVVFNVFTTPELDMQSGLWWVPLETLTVTNEVIVLELASLSTPLIVAKDDGKLWFLTL
jgi:hypothetical protein